MKIVYVVDVHDRFAVVPRALSEIGAVDLLVVGGDITTFGTPDDAMRAIDSWRPLVPRILAVAGNMDSPAIDERLVELDVSLNGRGFALGDIGIAGVSAAPHSPLNTPYEISDRELGARASAGLEEIKGCRVRLLCPHAPPHGTVCDRLRSGEHVGSLALRTLVEQEQPDLVLCGHIHEARGEDVIDASRIVNPGPVASGHYALVEIDGTITVTLDSST